MQTRPAIKIHDLNVEGPLQGCLAVNPGSGVSVRTFGEDAGYLILVAGGKAVVKNVMGNGFSPGVRQLRPATKDNKGNDVCVNFQDFIWLYKAEHFVIFQGGSIPTMWWSQEQDLSLTVSGGLSENYQTREHVNGQTFIEGKIDNWLANSAGLGVFALGRVLQQSGQYILASDMINSRGFKSSSDFLHMEEQMREACGGPLHTRSDVGELKALTVALNPKANGLGESFVTAYYTKGIVTYNVGQAPRETRFDPASGQEITKGWEYMEMVTPLCNEVSATGPYAVAVLLRDQWFRSPYGLHYLSRVQDQNTNADEPMDHISDEVGPVLNEDSVAMLHGCTVGYWIAGHRLMASTGFVNDRCAGVLPSARGLVVYNKHWGRTEDDSPLPCWEGVWVPPSGVRVQRLTSIPRIEGPPMYGFVGTLNKNRLVFCEFVNYDDDVNCGEVLPIPWVYTTDRVSRDGYATSTVIDSGFVSLHQRGRSLQLRVLIRTNRQPLWQEWTTDEGRAEPGCWRVALGSPADALREAEWFQFRLEGSGSASLLAFDLEVSPGSSNNTGDFIPAPADDRDPVSYLELYA